MLFYDPILCLKNFGNGYAFGGEQVEWQNDSLGNHLSPLPLEGGDLLQMNPRLFIWEVRLSPRDLKNIKIERALFQRTEISSLECQVSESRFLHTYLYSPCPTCSIERCYLCKGDDKYTIHGRLFKTHLFLSSIDS